MIILSLHLANACCAAGRWGGEPSHWSQYGVPVIGRPLRIEGRQSPEYIQVCGESFESIGWNDPVQGFVGVTHEPGRPVPRDRSGGCEWLRIRRDRRDNLVAIQGFDGRSRRLKSGFSVQWVLDSCEMKPSLTRSQAANLRVLSAHDREFGRLIEGSYSSDADTSARCWIASNGRGGVKLGRERGFLAVGFLVGSEFTGAIEPVHLEHPMTPNGGIPWIFLRVRKGRSIELSRWVGPGEGDIRREVWKRSQAMPASVPTPTPPTPSALVHPESAVPYRVDSLAEPGTVTEITRGPVFSLVEPVPAEYPALARQAAVEGVVILSVLVRTDGSVGRVKVAKSIPMLDPAAIASVSRWRFDPALAGEKPVTVWITVPMRFTLH
jgi:TonB family protein